MLSSCLCACGRKNFARGVRIAVPRTPLAPKRGTLEGRTGRRAIADVVGASAKVLMGEPPDRT